MSSPIIDPADLGTYLNDPSINTARATALIADAQTLCEDIVSPLPATAAVVVKRVAARAYRSSGSRQRQLAAADDGMLSGPVDVYLSQYDIADLRRASGGGGAFSISVLPADYVAPVTDYCSDDWDNPA